MADKNSTRPKDTHGSWVVKWSGKNNEVPTMTSSNWAPGYTPAHCATQGEALAAAMAKVTQETAIVRQRWISLSMILEQNREAYQHEVADGVSAMIADVPGIVIVGGKNNEPGLPDSSATEVWTPEEIEALEKAEAEDERERLSRDPEEDWLPRG